MSLERRLLNIVLMFVVIMLVGGVGYVLIERWSWIDALYMAIITVTTVGFGEVHPLTPAGRLFTAILVLLGVGGITYSFTALTNYVIAGELGDVYEEFKMKQQINSLRDHNIVCGFGRVGRQVCVELLREGRPLVVIESDETVFLQAKQQEYLVVKGDAGQDEVLRQAGIERAKGLVAALDSDASNLYVVLSARALRQDLYIVTRADSEDTSAKLLRAGADRVISPYSLGGRRMAQMLVHPDVVDFLELVMQDDELQLFLEDLTVGVGCPIDCMTVGKARIREATGANLLGIKREDGMIVSPEPSTTLHTGDVLVALGTAQQLATLAELVHSPESI
ncbi:potassium channel family protein [Chloroflexota bacterium]